jgi:hypothetical protein
LFVIHNDLPTVRTSNWTEREVAQCHGRIASRLKAAMHVHITAPGARGKIGRGTSSNCTYLLCHIIKFLHNWSAQRTPIVVY